MARTRINKEGYREFSNTGNLVHRWVAEKKYGKDKVKGMVVHHIDKDKLNNNPNNLLLVSKEDHHNIHQHENKKDFLIDAVMILTIVSFVLGVIGRAMGYQGIVSIAGTFVGISICLLIELKSGIISRVIRNPNEPMKRSGSPQT